MKIVDACLLKNGNLKLEDMLGKHRYCVEIGDVFDCA